MKILLLADAKSIHTQRWAKGLLELGYEIAIFSLNLPEKEIAPGIKVWGQQIFNNEKSDLSKSHYLKALFNLKRAIKEFKPDILHAHYATSYGLLGALSGFQPLYLSVWGSDVLIFPQKSLLHRGILHFVLSRSSKIFSTSLAMKSAISAMTDRKIQVIPFGIDTQKFSCTKKPFQEKTITLGTVKNLDPIYGIDQLIKVFAQLKSELPKHSLKLKLSSKGSMYHQYIQLTQELKIQEDVEFVTELNFDKVPDFYNSLDIAVFPSLSESFGVTALEALSCGRPVVANDIDGLQEILKTCQYSEGLVDTTQSQLFANKLKKIILEKKHFTKEIPSQYVWKNNLNNMHSAYSSKQ
jgi:L-malate glycosyltransferase